MTFIAESNTIQARVAALWTYTPIEFPNVEIAKPFPNPASPSTSSWARLTIPEGEGATPTVGATLDEYIGLAVIDIFTPWGCGSGQARTWASAIAPSFRRLVVSDVHFRTPSFREVGRDREDPAWFHSKLLCPFYREERP